MQVRAARPGDAQAIAGLAEAMFRLGRFRNLPLNRNKVGAVIRHATEAPDYMLAVAESTGGELAGTSPGRNTTSRALARLVGAGYIERVDGEPMGQARGVRVTDAGQRVLARGAARLDAAATVEADL